MTELKLSSAASCRDRTYPVGNLCANCRQTAGVPHIKLAFAICLASLTFMPAAAGQPVTDPPPTLNSSGQLNQTSIFNTPPPPDNIGEPGGRIGGGKRGCGDTGNDFGSSEAKVLTALVPVSDSGLVWGLTTAELPTFWFYVPYAAALPGEFVLQDEADRTVYQTSLTLSGTPGVVSVSLPATATPLEIGKRYHWYFIVNCDSEPIAFVHGWIQRSELNPALTVELEKSTPAQRVALYAGSGFWYDALTAAADIRRTGSQDTSYWAALLRDIRLDDIAAQPVLDFRF
ncbi:MAG: DUF928 domain-containing protein [Oscillatoria princeps RMCB-10]|nr:DUF928 domain-containing protein [Oscillatoria princeps RMCB-10]